MISEEEIRADLDLPIRVVGLQDNMALASPLPEYLPVQLEGRAMSLINLKLNRSAAVELDLKRMPLGHSRLSSERMNFVSSVSDVRMLRAKQALNVELDSRIDKKVPVHSKLLVNAARGFTLIGEPQIMPDSVYISGAREAISKIKSISTKETSITNLKWSNSLSVKLDLSSIPSIVDISDTAVFVQTHVEPLEYKIFSGIPVRLIGNFERGLYSLEPSRVDIEISGGRELLSKINQQNINLVIVFSRFAIENTNELEPTAHIPYPVASWQIHPEKFRLVRVDE